MREALSGRREAALSLLSEPGPDPRLISSWAVFPLPGLGVIHFKVLFTLSGGEANPA